ncbi:hypothetical protein P154DRAFT_576505 [Amniculicola lignicola CBS 123094]|uniref:Uncharacterized protein n=1 Tax=Amniculicola lignicola CBS 123094 TaxID=1392246 RepID=A0A6A5WDC2_9PLEO|nr:hypothetical protein P154DRAFT_576505 [Amniculicola lignicola CBS 123094]
MSQSQPTDTSEGAEKAYIFRRARLQVLDALYPDAFLGRFDVVHARFMMCSVDNAHARTLLG